MACRQILSPPRYSSELPRKYILHRLSCIGIIEVANKIAALNLLPRGVRHLGIYYGLTLNAKLRNVLILHFSGAVIIEECARFKRGVIWVHPPR
jgi:hypothetical protein